MKKATSMCSDLMLEAGQGHEKIPRQTFDVTRTIEEVVGLVAPVVPTQQRSIS
jgi:hypothetical protein